jgi:hypothetical protein
MSRCSSAKVFGGSGMPSGVCTVARRSTYLCKLLIHKQSEVPSLSDSPLEEDGFEPSVPRCARIAESAPALGRAA